MSFKRLTILFLIFIYIQSKKESSLNLKSTPNYKSIIESYGYNFEEFEIRTEDKYINSIWKITSKKKQKNFLSTNKAIILQHGLLDNGWTWFVLQEKSLPFTLADKGYDVWISHNRGTLFSTGHVESIIKNYLNPFSPYWDFSFDDFARYDLPSVINFALKKSNVQKIDYIGHSQGTLIFFLQYMINPSFMENSINKFIGLGTVPNVNNAESYITNWVAKNKQILEYYPFGNFMRLGTTIGPLISEICDKIPEICGFIVNKIVENDISTKRMNFPKISKNLFLYEPGGTSIKNMRHWIQIFSDKKLHRYDYGKEENLKHYGTEEPPLYDIDAVKKWNIKGMVTTSNADPFCNPIDTEEFVARIENKDAVKILKLENYNHLDYVWADDACRDLYPKIFEFLQ